mmetsp:Transcript_3367/g.9870  ORF Transcript_3367/g.9870 Transcript_3367/m.9870 type:complete len:89 (+) Transcript_3367:273-539(+)
MEWRWASTIGTVRERLRWSSSPGMVVKFGGILSAVDGGAGAGMKTLQANWPSTCGNWRRREELPVRGPGGIGGSGCDSSVSVSVSEDE